MGKTINGPFSIANCYVSHDQRVDVCQMSAKYVHLHPLRGSCKTLGASTWPFRLTVAHRPRSPGIPSPKIARKIHPDGPRQSKIFVRSHAKSPDFWHLLVTNSKKSGTASKLSSLRSGLYFSRIGWSENYSGKHDFLRRGFLTIVPSTNPALFWIFLGVFFQDTLRFLGSPSPSFPWK